MVSSRNLRGGTQVHKKNSGQSMFGEDPNWAHSEHKLQTLPTDSTGYVSAQDGYNVTAGIHSAAERKKISFPIRYSLLVLPLAIWSVTDVVFKETINKQTVNILRLRKINT
jgi:hypothetical protein